MSNLKYVLEHTMLEEDEVIALVLPSGKQVWKGYVKDAYPLAESYSFKRFLKPDVLTEKFNKPSEVLEVESLKKEEIKKPIKSSSEYLLNTKDDVLKAIKFFNHQKPEKEEDYAHAIIDKMHEYGISSDKITADNRLCKYVDSCTADLSDGGEKLEESKEITMNRYKVSMSYNKEKNTVNATIISPVIKPNPDQINDVIKRAREAAQMYASGDHKHVKFNAEIKYPDNLQEHISGTMTAEDIAKKHNVDVETINKQVELGIKVEHEHTKDDDEAKRIALDHLFELPDYYDRLGKMEEEGEKALTEAPIPGEHKCPNCGATLDAWDGTFCDKKCKEEYENRNNPKKESKKESTNEELLTEKPLYTVDDNDKDFGRREIKKMDGSSFKSKEEVEEFKNSGGITKSNSGMGCFSPDGTYVDGDYKSRDVAFFNHKQTGKFSAEKPEKVYKAKKYKNISEAFVDDKIYNTIDRIEILCLLENKINLGDPEDDNEPEVLTEGKVRTFFAKAFVRFLPEKALDKILVSLKTRIQQTSGTKKEQVLKEIDSAKDKKAKRELIRKYLDLAPESKVQQADAYVEAKVKQKGKTTDKPQAQLTEAIVVAAIPATTALIAIGISGAVGLILGILLAAIPAIVGNVKESY